MLDTEACWEAVLNKDNTQDGKFFFGVTTTGVYCRPSCPARKPQRQNVKFYKTPQEAEKDGLRACRRCLPLNTGDEGKLMRELSELIRAESASGKLLTLATLSARAKMSPFHLQRTFKEIVGVSPKQFVEACRMKALKGELRARDSVTDAIYEAGFGSSSRVYEQVDTRLGMTPGAARRGGMGEQIRFAVGETFLGDVLVAATDKGVCAIMLGDDPDDLAKALQDRFPRAELVGGDEKFERMVATVVGLVEAPGQNLDLPLDVRGTAFQQRVWQALRAIPSGRTSTYAEIAQTVGYPKAARAVAQACAANPLAVAIPCHRVVRADGALSGYRWGVERKRKLLDREAT